MSIPIFQVDAFSDRLFSGNPAGVTILPQEGSPQWMQSLAMEMNLSETAFLVPTANGFHLRWFTPVAEVALCGHATLAAAHILWTEKLLPEDQPACFHTLSGMLTATKRNEWIDLNFPAKPIETELESPELERVLGVKAIFIGKSQFDYLVEVENEEIVRTLQPDFGQLRDLPVRGVIVTSKASLGDYDFVSRFFAPAVGVNEDPVTGSAHCSLGPYWQGKTGKGSFKAYQASPRGGVLLVSVQKDRVILSGQAVTVFRGELSD